VLRSHACEDVEVVPLVLPHVLQCQPHPVPW
jgi:hypothetical protein